MTRSYRAPAREQAAAQTRTRIVAAARDLLLDRGPSAMTVNDLARTASVSPQTVYNSIGGKAQVIKTVYDVLLAGDDDPTPMSERPAFRAVIDAPDVAAYAAAYAAWTYGIQTRVGRLLATVLADGTGGDPELAGFVAKINEERRIGNRNGLQGLRRRGEIPSGRQFERIVDSVWVLTAPETHDRLVRQRGWSGRSYTTWLAHQLRTALTYPRAR